MDELKIPYQFDLAGHTDTYLMAVRLYLADLTERLAALPPEQRTPQAMVRLIQNDVQASGLAAEQRAARSTEQETGQ